MNIALSFAAIIEAYNYSCCKVVTMVMSGTCMHDILQAMLLGDWCNA